jgi:hypothetical protein
LSKAIQFAPSNFPDRTWSLNYDDGGSSGNGFNISSQSTKILYLNGNGNVGIGTSSPNAKLSVLTSAMNSQIVVGENSDSTAYGAISFSGGLSNATRLGFTAGATGNSSLYLDVPATGGFQFRVAATTIMTLDTSGNLGLGVTPSAWYSFYDALQFGNFGFIASSQGTSISANAYRNSVADYIYLTSSLGASFYDQYNGSHVWYQAASGTAGNVISFTQAMTLDASGNLALGQTTATDSANFSRALDINGPSGSALYARTAGSATNWTYYGNAGNSGYINNNGNGVLAFYNNGSERMRIDSSGNLLVGTTNSSNSAGTGIKFSANGLAASVIADSGTAADTWNVYNTTAGAFRFYVTNNGTIFATSTTISAISDERLKENIQDIDTGLNAIMALKPRRFDWKEGKGQDKKNVAGFIAQEFETVFPECVSTSKAGEDGIEYKNINHETLIPTLVKAMQEQQALIQSLKARLDAANL